MKRIALAAVMLAGTVTPAFAQSTDSTPFTGPRVELHGGWDWLRARTDTNDGVTAARSTIHNNDGFFGGQIGYDYAIQGHTVVGVFGSYDLSNNEQCAFNGFAAACLKANRNIEAGARIGEIVGGTNLIYLKGAYVNGKFSASVSDPEDEVYYSAHEKQGGWRAGVGLEHALGQHAYAKVEYNYSRYGRFNGDLGDEAFSTRITRQEALGGLGIRF
jgi:outer membrane immunogenic protein